MKRKIRRFIAAALALTLCAAGVFYGVNSASDSSDNAVEVCPVQNVNSYYGPSYTDTIEGTIISKDTQTVELDTDHELKAVYVEEGDTVKKGDKLLEYNMQSEELNAEREDLNRRIQELELATLRNELDLLNRGIVPDDVDSGTSVDSDDYDDSVYDDIDDEADVDDEDADYTGSEDVAVQEDGADNAAAAEDDPADASAYVSASDEAASGTDSSQTDEADDGLLIVEDDSFSSDADTSDDGITSDDGQEYMINEDDGGLIGDSTDDSSIEESSYDASLIEDVYSFMSAVNDITGTANSSLANLGTAEELSRIRNAMLTFQTQFADTVESQRTNLLGENVTVSVCTVKDSVAAIVGENITLQLQEAWDRLSAYQFVAAVQMLNPKGKSSAKLGTSYALENEELIRSAADALLSLPESVYNDQTMQFTESYGALNSAWTSGGESRVQFLVNLSGLLNSASVVVQSTEQGEEDIISTEGINPDDNYDDGGYDDGGYDDGSEAVDFAQLIKDKEREIKEKELDIRDTTLSLKEYEKRLSSKIIYAQMDGIVMNAGTVDAQTDGGAFITITGRAGLYVRGSIKESELGSVNIGDTVSGTTYEGQDFTAEIVEISPYPDTGSSDYSYFYDSTGNESTYPFLAFIEDADGLEVDSGVDMTIGSSGSLYDTSASLSLEEYFIRKDPDGRSYCYVRGEDGLLEKRFLQVGNIEWGTAEIESGLTPSDYIAFPYGDNVKEGAETKIVDMLSAVESYY